MIILLIVIIVSIAVVGIILRNNLNFFWFCGIVIGWFLSTTAFLLFYVKCAGYSFYTNRFLFVFDSIRVFLLYSPISLTQITRIQAFGRSLFVFCLLGYSCYHTDILRSKTKHGITLLNGILSLVNLCVYSRYANAASIFSPFTLKVFSVIIRGWAVLVALSSAVLLVMHYRATSFRWFRIKQLCIDCGIAAMTSFWLCVILPGPIQYQKPQSYFYLYPSFTFSTPPISPAEWIMWEFALTILISLSLYSLLQYSRYQQRFQMDQTRINNKMMFTRTGVSILNHAVKNHLLSSNFLLADIISQQKQGASSVEMLKMLNLAIQKNDSMLQRLNNLSASMKNREINLHPTQIKVLFDETLKQINIPENISVTFQVSLPRLTVLMDLDVMVEVLINIIKNAVEAIGDSQGHIRISQQVENRYCMLKIEDDGPGLNKLQLGQVFEPFYSSKNSSFHWGIGLSTCKQMVAAHGGLLEAESALNKGSAFIILLPVGG